MIIGIVGLGGAGKTSLMVHMLGELVVNQRRALYKNCIEKIQEYNVKRKTPLTFPDRAPIYTNFDVTVPIGYKKTFTPYYMNPYYFGMPGLDIDTIPVMPGSWIFFSETDKIYDSREKSLPSAVSSMFNKQRHFDLNIVFETHRGMNTDVLIRENIHKYIEVLGNHTERDLIGNVIQTTWKCREFEGAKNYFQYLETKGQAKTYTEKIYEHFGNIFSRYNSRACESEFVPPEGKDFIILEQRGHANLKGLPKDYENYYSEKEPKKWR